MTDKPDRIYETMIEANQGLNWPSSHPTIAEISADFRRMMAEAGVTLEDLLSGLEDAREAAFLETYGRPSIDNSVAAPDVKTSG